MPTKRLVLEITESMVVADPARALPILARLHELGVEISVDDFGTGFSSMDYLKRLPVKEVKIDRSFVTDDGDRRARRGHRALHDRPRAQPRAARRGRGRRDAPTYARG